MKTSKDLVRTKIERLTLDSESATFLNKFILVFPDQEICNIGYRFKSDDGLDVIYRYLPIEAKAIEQTLYRMFLPDSGQVSKIHKKSINKIDLYLAFSGDYYLQSTKKFYLDSLNRNLIDRLIKKYNLSFEELIFLNNLKVVEINDCGDEVVGNSDKIGFANLFFWEARQNNMRARINHANHYGILRYSTVITIISNEKIIKKINKVVSESPCYCSIIEMLSGKVYDFKDNLAVMNDLSCENARKFFREYKKTPQRWTDGLSEILDCY